MKAHWAKVETQVRNGETFEVLNRGRPSVMIIPARPHEVLAWDDHLGITSTSPFEVFSCRLSPSMVTNTARLPDCSSSASRNAAISRESVSLVTLGGDRGD